jgi:hypothetical protein
MIISNLIGGLGNQMFQYACGLALSIRTGQTLRISTDQLHGYKLHNGFELQRVFGVATPLATKREMKEMLGLQSSPLIRRILGRPSMRWASFSRGCIEPHFHYWPALHEWKGPAYLHGYWQSDRYFSDIADQVREEFRFQQPWDEEDLAVRARMRQQPSASLHVRRGDYTSPKNQGVYVQSDINYYRSAISYLRERVPNVRFFAFSDDPDWVAANLLPTFGAVDIVRHNTGIRSANDMRLMSEADHQITANSSFSWWGAWLNENQEKIVIAPKLWFSDGRNDSDLVPTSWKRL